MRITPVGLPLVLWPKSQQIYLGLWHLATFNLHSIRTSCTTWSRFSTAPPIVYQLLLVACEVRIECKLDIARCKYSICLQSELWPTLHFLNFLTVMSIKEQWPIEDFGYPKPKMCLGWWVPAFNKIPYASPCNSVNTNCLEWL